jgi:hypothetical protein
VDERDDTEHLVDDVVVADSDAIPWTAVTPPSSDHRPSVRCL